MESAKMERNIKADAGKLEKKQFEEWSQISLLFALTNPFKTPES